VFEYCIAGWFEWCWIYLRVWLLFLLLLLSFQSRSGVASTVGLLHINSTVPRVRGLTAGELAVSLQHQSLTYKRR
jgi:hypothetical protein